LERTSLAEAFGETGVLATIAFLVVFRVLIRDFFWIVTMVSLVSRRFKLPRTLWSVARGMPNGRPAPVNI
jgi:hypothetical protein